MRNTLKLIFLMIISPNCIAQIGCTDTYATNYNMTATTNNGSCIYNYVSVIPLNSVSLSSQLIESSGLIEWNGFLYTHNDNSDTSLYKLNKITGQIVETIALNSIENIDWEEISQDDNYIYIGDFGNNTSGNRTNLKIYKIAKSSLNSTPIIETINFSYANQIDFSVQSANNTNFDCEAFVITNTEILLFTKQWLNNQTSVYSLPKTAGIYSANLLTTINVNGLITGATQKTDSRLIALSGYSSSLQPFIFLLYDFFNTDFNNANKRKIEISLPFHQVEGISTINGKDYYISNESFIQTPFINNPQKLHTLTISNYINDYLNLLTVNSNENSSPNDLIAPNPTSDEIYFNSDNNLNKYYQIFNVFGQLIQSGIINENKINFAKFQNGIYFLKIENNYNFIRVIKN